MAIDPNRPRRLAATNQENTKDGEEDGAKPCDSEGGRRRKVPPPRITTPQRFIALRRSHSAPTAFKAVMTALADHGRARFASAFGASYLSGGWWQGVVEVRSLIYQKRGAEGDKAFITEFEATFGVDEFPGLL